MLSSPALAENLSSLELAESAEEAEILAMRSEQWQDTEQFNGPIYSHKLIEGEWHMQGPDGKAVNMTEQLRKGGGAAFEEHQKIISDLFSKGFHVQIKSPDQIHAGTEQAKADYEAKIHLTIYQLVGDTIEMRIFDGTREEFKEQFGQEEWPRRMAEQDDDFDDLGKPSAQPVVSQALTIAGPKSPTTKKEGTEKTSEWDKFWQALFKPAERPAEVQKPEPRVLQLFGMGAETVGGTIEHNQRATKIESKEPPLLLGLFDLAPTAKDTEAPTQIEDKLQETRTGLPAAIEVTASNLEESGIKISVETDEPEQLRLIPELTGLDEGYSLTNARQEAAQGPKSLEAITNLEAQDVGIIKPAIAQTESFEQTKLVSKIQTESLAQSALAAKPETVKTTILEEVINRPANSALANPSETREKTTPDETIKLNKALEPPIIEVALPEKEIKIIKLEAAVPQVSTDIETPTAPAAVQPLQKPETLAVKAEFLDLQNTTGKTHTSALPEREGKILPSFMQEEAGSAASYQNLGNFEIESPQEAANEIQKVDGVIVPRLTLNLLDGLKLQPIPVKAEATKDLAPVIEIQKERAPQTRTVREPAAAVRLAPKKLADKEQLISSRDGQQTESMDSTANNFQIKISPVKTMLPVKPADRAEMFAELNQEQDVQSRQDLQISPKPVQEIRPSLLKIELPSQSQPEPESSIIIKNQPQKLDIPKPIQKRQVEKTALKANPLIREKQEQRQANYNTTQKETAIIRPIILEKPKESAVTLSDVVKTLAELKATRPPSPVIANKVPTLVPHRAEAHQAHKGRLAQTNKAIEANKAIAMENSLLRTKRLGNPGAFEKPTLSQAIKAENYKKIRQSLKRQVFVQKLPGRSAANNQNPPQILTQDETPVISIKANA